MRYKDIYEISSFGRVRTIKKFNPKTKKYPYILALSYDAYGYLTVNLQNDKFKVHRLVALHFIGKRSSKVPVNHIDGIKTNNRVENLEWSSPKHNIQHALKIGSIKRGEKSKASKLTFDDRVKIYGMIYNGFARSWLAKKYNVSVSTIDNVANKKHWGKVYE